MRPFPWQHPDDAIARIKIFISMTLRRRPPKALKRLPRSDDRVLLKGLHDQKKLLSKTRCRPCRNPAPEPLFGHGWADRPSSYKVTGLRSTNRVFVCKTFYQFKLKLVILLEPPVVLVSWLFWIHSQSRGYAKTFFKVKTCTDKVSQLAIARNQALAAFLQSWPRKMLLVSGKIPSRSLPCDQLRYAQLLKRLGL